SEVTGLAFSPDGNRLYFNSERGLGLAGLPIGPGPGITYEVTGPFRGGSLATEAVAPPADPPPPDGPPPSTGGTLPATGGGVAPLGAGLAAATAAGALLRLRRRATGPG